MYRRVKLTPRSRKYLWKGPKLPRKSLLSVSVQHPAQHRHEGRVCCPLHSNHDIWPRESLIRLTMTLIKVGVTTLPYLTLIILKQEIKQQWNAAIGVRTGGLGNTVPPDLSRQRIFGQSGHHSSLTGPLKWRLVSQIQPLSGIFQ